MTLLSPITPFKMDNTSDFIGKVTGNSRLVSDAIEAMWDFIGQEVPEDTPQEERETFWRAVDKELAKEFSDYNTSEQERGDAGDRLALRAIDAFWDIVAKDHAEIKSGDVAPEFVLEMERTAEDWIARWIRHNSPGA